MKFLPSGIKHLLFVPYAGVTISHSDYAEKVRRTLQSSGLSVKSIHEADDKQFAIDQAEAVMVGGGNTFALADRLHKDDLLASIRRKVLAGTPYIGWSAGANLACPTIMTTNDMPVVQPPSFAALNLISFQINPHYHELKFENQGGETRKERLEEFLVVNPDKKVVGLPEGTLLLRQDDKLFFKGNGTGKLYRYEKPVENLAGEQDISFLLE